MGIHLKNFPSSEVWSIRRNVSVGEKYGHLTILAQEGVDKRNMPMYRCLCDCGNQPLVQKSFLFKHDHICCIHCSPTTLGQRRRKNLVGKKLNGWHVIRIVDHRDGIYFYECKCLNCATISIKRGGQIDARKSVRCQNCAPEYHFEIEGDRAIGTLADGTKFLIDADDVARVSERYWHMGKESYIVSAKGVNKSKALLHRWILGVTNPSIFVDHINRDRLDNRRINLRKVTSTENAYNRSLASTNRTGFIGVYYSTYSRRYEAKVGYRKKRIYLGSSRDDLVRLAQMYNIGAKFLYGDFAGEMNNVPEPDKKLIARIERKCLQYKNRMDERSTLSKECFSHAEKERLNEHNYEPTENRCGMFEACEIQSAKRSETRRACV